MDVVVVLDGIDEEEEEEKEEEGEEGEGTAQGVVGRGM